MSREKWGPNPDIEKETVFPAYHCEHLKGACLHAEVTAFTDSLCYLGVTARRRGNLIAKGRDCFVSSGNKSKAAKILRVDYKTLLSKIKEYEIRYGIDCRASIP